MRGIIMKRDLRFSLDSKDLGDSLSIELRAIEPVEISGETVSLLSIGFEELCAMARAPEHFYSAFERRAEEGALGIILNGWQSWSWGGEIDFDDVQTENLLGISRTFGKRPGKKLSGAERREWALSHFYIGLRSADTWLFAVSRNEGGAPIGFRFSRKDLTVNIQAFADGARYSAGEKIAEIRIFCCDGIFAVKDAFARIFGGMKLFDRLEFLGNGNSLVPGGYESWYNHYTKISEALIQDDLGSIGSSDNLINSYYIKPGKPTVFQIDDGWENTVGEWEANSKFPNGMKPLAEQIEARGLIPGLWLAPVILNRSSKIFREKPEWLLRDASGRLVRAGFNPGWEGSFYALDLSVPEVDDYLYALFDKVIDDWGYRYLKLDFLYAAFLLAKRVKGGAAFEHYNRVFGKITSRTKNKKGQPVAWLGCGAVLESSYRFFPLMRIGADTKGVWEDSFLRFIRHEGRPAAYTNMSDTIGRSIMDRRIFINDPDVVFMRSANLDLTENEKELVALVDFMLASQIMFSDDTKEFGEKSELEFTKRILELYKRLEGREYAAARIGPDVYSVSSRDGKVRGIANLSDAVVPLPEGLYNRGTPLVEHVAAADAKAAAASLGTEGMRSFEPHSISLYIE